MAYFTDMNTEGFTESDLETLNEAMDILIADGWDEQAATDKLNNAWCGGETAAELVAYISK